MDAMLSAENIRKTFRLKNGQSLNALEGISFNVRKGGLTALVGPDGAGKSTLLRIVAGLLRHDSGTLVFNGAEITRQSGDLQSQIGYMPQKFGLYEDLTVQENLDLYADLKGVGQKEREKRYRELLAMSAMEPFRSRQAGKLSGGMKQKLGLICTLISPPKLLLLDEPTVGVDPLSRRELWDIVTRLTAAEGMSVIVSTSYLDEAERCDEVALLFEGKMLYRGTPDEIRSLTAGMSFLTAPVDTDTPRSLQARILDAPGIIDAVPQGGVVRFVHDSLSDAEQDGLAACLRGAKASAAEPSLEDSFMLLLRTHSDNQSAGSDVAAAEKNDAFLMTNVPEPSASQDVAVSGGNGFSSIEAEKSGISVRRSPIIETKHVFRLFGDFIAVNDVSFSVYPGEVFGLLGPNGAGKTTTFRMLCGLLPASKGDLFVAGVNVRKTREEARRHLGYVAQKFSLYGPLTARENLEFFAGAYGLRGKKKNERIHVVVEDFNLEDRLDYPAADLPGGYKQRLAMAVGLLHEPEILFLDEATSGADPLARRNFWKRISRLAAQGVTVIVTTHFMEEAEYCDRMLIQDSGRLLALGTPNEIRSQGGVNGKPALTMEDAFIRIVAKFRASQKEAA
ncbi:MAG: ABC transporter ATP-binding protein [Mailhella sp.]|nr:ABC transporter ATP-binding protein [Mailhella sp.]